MVTWPMRRVYAGREGELLETVSFRRIRTVIATWCSLQRPDFQGAIGWSPARLRAARVALLF